MTGRNEMSRLLHRWRAALAVCAFVWLQVCCFGQFESSAVLGVVQDASGGVVIGTVVKLENLKTGIVRTTLSDHNGDYQFLDVRAGSYRLTAEARGFRMATTAPFDVTVDARQRVALRLNVESASQTVTVSGEV